MMREMVEVEVSSLFQIGDKVVHPMHGAGIVESIVQKKVNGVMRDYYVLKLPVRAMEDRGSASKTSCPVLQ